MNIFGARQKQDALKRNLAMQRPMMSLMERDLLAVTGDLVLDTDNWVTMWVDAGHAVNFGQDDITAYRGICSEGQLMWLVRHADKTHGYHSLETDPLAAVEEARRAWDARRRNRQRWDEVTTVANDLLAGRQKFAVTIEDAYASPLCNAGIDAFMRRMKLGRVTRISGRMAAFLMKVEPQVGFVILAAMDRVGEARQEPGTTLTEAAN